ncbi:hypothetical protein F2Q69_00053968 [Brassica cretica]|uniref:Replication factor A C-terminal domain-containing protein n=1 Tax=Brassica cretica TaxID=69181 RepID=A0A8S9N3A3_BRACR|nr:hypothetical protein F2Q69_00053968 [Brassica cretica]
MKLFGVSDSVKTNGEAVVPSSPVKPVAQTGVSSGDVNSMKSKGVAAVSSSLIKPISKTSASSGLNIGIKGKASVSSGTKDKAIISDNVGQVIIFKDVTFRPHEGEVQYQLIHFWEAWNAQTKVLIGLEMLLIYEEGFIPYGRIETYLRHMKAGATYRLNKFFGSKSKTIYRVAEPSVTISFSWNSVLEDSSIRFPEDRFRIHGYREFEAASDLRGDLYDYVGHIKLVNGHVPSDSLLLDEAEIAASRRDDLHVQTHDDPVLKLYPWDKAAFELSEKFKASGGTARVILVITLNPKRFGGVLSLSSMASSRVFLDSDVQETRFYLSWLNSNLDVANRVNAEVVTKPETATLGELFSYMNQTSAKASYLYLLWRLHGYFWIVMSKKPGSTSVDVANRVNAEVVTKPETATLGELFSYMNQTSAKVAWFECTATIDDVVHGSGWYYIGCGVCHTKATKVQRLCLSVYDHNDQAIFVFLGDAGEALTGKKAVELVERYYPANDSVGEDHIVPVPQAMIDTIGQTRKFIVKVSNHNLTAKTQTLTVTKVLPLEAPEPEGNLGENVGEESYNEREDHEDESVKRGADGIESEGVKHTKCG